MKLIEIPTREGMVLNGELKDSLESCDHHDCDHHEEKLCANREPPS